MKNSIILAALTGLVCLAGLALAQSYVDQILLVDVKSNGTAVHYFSRNPPLFWNFQGGAKINASTKALDIGPNVQATAPLTISGPPDGGTTVTVACSTCATTSPPDGGAAGLINVKGSVTAGLYVQAGDGGVISAEGIQIGTTGARPTCAAGLRGTFFTVESNATGDAGIKDLTYQCCKAADGTYSWVAVACQ